MSTWRWRTIARTICPSFIRAALAGEPLQVHGDGQQSRCFCDVRDVVDVLPRLLEAPQCAGRVFNLGSDAPIRIRDLADLVRQTLGSDSPVEHVPYAEAFGEGFDDLRERRPDLTRIREAVGFQARIPLVQTIRDVAATLAAQRPVAAATEATP
jgi:UDP-glucose 4-epimerase